MVFNVFGFFALHKGFTGFTGTARVADAMPFTGGHMRRTTAPFPSPSLILQSCQSIPSPPNSCKDSRSAQAVPWTGGGGGMREKLVIILDSEYVVVPDLVAVAHSSQITQSSAQSECFC